MNSLVDTHTHLFLEQFDNDRDTVIQSAIQSGITKLILPNVDSTSLDSLLDMVRKYPANCFAAIGLHPTSVKENYKEEFSVIEEAIHSNNIVAIGEIGIDLYWDKTHIEHQRDMFTKQIEIALAMDLPVIIHNRDAFSEVYKIVSKYKNQNLKGIFHSFSGSLDNAKQAIDLGFFIGLGGVLTFKNSGLGEIAEQIPLKHIVLETDSPYLAPVPHRGKRNESSYLTLVAQRLAEIKQLPLEEICQTTSKNACELFKLD
jgi:TatD DNase family protein